MIEERMQELFDELRSQGYEVVIYAGSPEKRQWHTLIGVDSDHGVLDALRDVLVEWHNREHESTLAFS